MIFRNSCVAGMKNTAALWSQIAPLKLKPETGSCTYIQLAYTTKISHWVNLPYEVKKEQSLRVVFLTVSVRKINQNTAFVLVAFQIWIDFYALT